MCGGIPMFALAMSIIRGFCVLLSAVPSTIGKETTGPYVLKNIQAVLFVKSLHLKPARKEYLLLGKDMLWSRNAEARCSPCSECKLTLLQGILLLLDTITLN